MNLKGDLDEAHVERVGRELVSAGAIVDLYKDAIRLPNGEIHYWDMVSHRKGAAAIVAVRDDGKLLMVRQYRPALNRYTLEIPAGARDSVDEDPCVTANRELEEETGFIPNEMKHLLSLKTTVAFCDEFIEVYLSRGLHDRKEQMLDDAESIDIIACDLDDLIDLIFDGTIQDSKTVSGILAYYKLVREK
ncbi:MAG: NUDIX hydrolase [Lachnospiraceae bacterium]|nr:NUDIX hydrolase [Lachnospiraceae bacterium]